MTRRREVALIVTLAVLLASVLALAPGFFSATHLRGLALDRLPILVAALGMTIVIVSGQIDVAVGAELAVLSALLGTLAKLGFAMPACVALTLLAGLGLGAMHAVLVTALRAPALLVTLASLGILREGLRLAFGGAWILDLPRGFPWLGFSPELGGILYLVVALGLALGVAGFLRFTRNGRAVHAVGGGPDTAALLGVPVGATRALALTILGGLVAVAAVLHATRYPTIETEVGLGFELEVIACVVVGGALPSGGRGSVLGTCLGWALFALLGSTLVYLRVDAAWEKAVAGALLVLGVAADTAFAARNERHA